MHEPGKVITVWGKNFDVDIAAAEDICTAGATWTPPTQERVHAIVSSSAADDAASTGARTSRIIGLDGAWNDVSEDVTMDGTTPVNTANAYGRINNILFPVVGSGLKNASNVSATAATDGTVSCHAQGGYGRSSGAHWSVGVRWSALLMECWASANTATPATLAGGEVQLLVRSYSESRGAMSGWETIALLRLDNGVARVNLHKYKVPPKSDIIMRGTALVDNTIFVAGYTLRQLAA